MSARVIQDSDDEDDPLSCEAQPPPPPTTIARRSSPAEVIALDGPGEVNEYQVQAQAPEVNVNANANKEPGVEDIGVNFDDFLQSQSQDYNSHSKYARDSLSSSQQRREDRWIPNGDGATRGSSSIELGLAQRRLMHDDALHLPSTASVPEDGLSLRDAHAIGAIDNYQGFGHPERPFPAHEIQGPYQPLRDPYNSLTENDNGDVNESYNIFDTSHNSLPTESLHRSKSLHITPSPHDTEPLSSLNAGQSRIDNIRHQNEGLPQQNLADINSQDELSAPVAVEIPTAPPQKRQSQKTPMQVEDDEDDELAGPKEDATTREINGNMENAGHSHNNTIRPTTSHEEPDLDSNKPADAEIQVISVNALEGSDNKQAKPKQSKAKPKATDKEPKKKKVKRGKTTSATVKKTYEPDVEDDVIWVNQPYHPSKPNPDHEHFIPTPDSISIAADEQPGNQAMQATVETPNVAQDQGQEQLAQEPEQKPAPAQPNKRGRKRKKTTEQVPPQPQELQPEQVQVQEPQEAEAQTHPRPEEESQRETQNTTSAPAPAPDEKSGEEPNTAKQPETPTKSQPPSQDPNTQAKGPTKHSPIPATSAPYRVGLSRRARIAPLLKIIRK